MAVRDTILQKYFASRKNSFAVGGIPFDTLYRRYPTPFVLYDLGVIQRKVEMLRGALPEFDIYFSIKSNPADSLLSFLHGLESGFNAATAQEIEKALLNGATPDRIILAGAGKLEEDLVAGVRAGVEEIHVDSFRELDLLDGYAAQVGRTVQVALRCNPGVEAPESEDVAAAVPQAYGFDEEELGQAVRRVQASSHLRLCGLHVYWGTQHLDKDFMVNAYRQTFRIAERMARLAGGPLGTIDFSGGFGVPYYANEEEFPIEAFGEAVRPLVEAARRQPLLKDTRLVIEPGRYLAAEGGLYVVKVLDIKVSHGKTFVITDGGIHHHLAATGNLGHVIKRNFPILVPSQWGQEAEMVVDIVGRQCTALDTLARNEKLPPVKPGDAIVFLQSGAYGLSVSPVQFRGQPRAREIFVADGKDRPAQRPERFMEINIG